MRAPTMASCAWLLMAAGCGTAPELDWQAKLAQQVRGDARSTAATELMPPVEADPAPGDRVEFAIALSDGDDAKSWRLVVAVAGVETRRVLGGRSCAEFESRVQPSEGRREQRAAATAAFRASPIDLWDLATNLPVARLVVEAFDESGASLGRAESDEIVKHLRRGLLDACRAGRRQCEVMRGRVEAGRDAPMLTLDDAAYDDVSLVATGVDTCKELFRILQANPVTRDILREVLALPSLWSILTNWGVKVSFAVDFFAAERVDPARFPGEGRELWSVPVMLLLNEQPGFLARVIVGPSGSPDGAVAGVFGIVARHPSDAQRTVTVRLVASRRGGSEAAVSPAR
jgi:hypothetical protein